MVIGVPKEIKANEKRVSLLPHSVRQIVGLGHNIVVQKNAGIESGISDSEYEKEGAQILPDINSVYEKSDVIIKVKEPLDVELELIRDSQIIFTFFHFAADKHLLEKFIKTNAIAVAYETVQDSKGNLPLLTPMSEIAGRMAIQNGAKYLEGTHGGKGVLLSGVPGVAPATVTIIGGGVVGLNSAKLAAGLGAKVNILDIDMDRLRYLDDIMPSNVFTHHSNSHTINNLLPKTDLLIGGVLVPGSKAPKIINKELSLIESFIYTTQTEYYMTIAAVEGIFTLLSPSNIATLLGTYSGGNIPDEVRPLSPLGLAQAGSQIAAYGYTNFLVY